MSPSPEIKLQNPSMRVSGMQRHPGSLRFHFLSRQTRCLDRWEILQRPTPSYTPVPPGKGGLRTQSQTRARCGKMGKNQLLASRANRSWQRKPGDGAPLADDSLLQVDEWWKGSTFRLGSGRRVWTQERDFLVYPLPHQGFELGSADPRLPASERGTPPRPGLTKRRARRPPRPKGGPPCAGREPPPKPGPAPQPPGAPRALTAFMAEAMSS